MCRGHEFSLLLGMGTQTGQFINLYINQLCQSSLRWRLEYLITLCCSFSRHPCDGGVRPHGGYCGRCQLPDWNHLHPAGGRHRGRREERKERSDHYIVESSSFIYMLRKIFLQLLQQYWGNSVFVVSVAQQRTLEKAFVVSLPYVLKV